MSSYKKAMKFASNPRKGKIQYTGFNVLDKNERHRDPWLGSAWFEPDMEEERKKYIEEYHKETEQLLKENKDLKIVE